MNHISEKALDINLMRLTIKRGEIAFNESGEFCFRETGDFANPINLSLWLQLIPRTWVSVATRHAFDIVSMEDELPIDDFIEKLYFSLLFELGDGVRN